MTPAGREGDRVAYDHPDEALEALERAGVVQDVRYQRGTTPRPTVLVELTGGRDREGKVALRDEDGNPWDAPALQPRFVRVQGRGWDGIVQGYEVVAITNLEPHVRSGVTHP